LKSGKTYAKLNWNGEEVTASLLCNSVTTLDTREVDKGWLDNTALALGGLEQLLGEAVIVSDVVTVS